MSKAFDLTLHSLMFSKILTLPNPYQAAHPHLCPPENSESFSVKNGCGKGKVLAAIAYCMYCEELFTILRRKQSGCLVLGYYRGIFGYSDDNWLLAPSLSALQDMLKTCEDYAMTHNLKFSTDPDPKKCKTKCMAFLTKPKKLSNVYLCGNPLPWVDSLKHLGNIVSNQIDGGQIDGHEDKDGQIH